MNGNEVDELVKRLVRRAHVVREDGDRQQVSREVITIVSTGGPNFLGWWVAMCKRRVIGRDAIEGKENKKEGQTVGSSAREVRERIVCH